MKTIHKYELAAFDSLEVRMPAYSEILSVGAQGDRVMLWLKVDTAQPLVPMYFEVRGTGHPLGDVGEFLGTAQLESGIVLHVFRGAYHAER